jgi:hypothetical protein
LPGGSPPVSVLPAKPGGRHVDLELARNYKNMTLDRIDFESKRD